MKYFRLTIVFVLLLLRMISYSQYPVKHAEISFSHLKSILINGEKYFEYPEQWDLGGEPFTIYDSLQNGKYLIYSYDNKRISVIFEVRDYKRICFQLFYEDSSSQIVNSVSHKRYFFDYKNRLSTVDSTVNDTTDLALTYYDTVGNKMVDKGNGQYIFYYKNGRKRSTGAVKNGLDDGKYTYWYEDGKICESGKYLNGEKVGKWKKWNSNGKKWHEPRKKEYDYNGILIKGIKFDNTLTRIDTTSFSAFLKIIKLLKSNEKLRLTLYFHTTVDYNLPYPKWMREVVDYFIDHGIDANRIFPKTFTNARPLISEAKLNNIRNKKKRSKMMTKNQRIEYFLEER
jgi:hypothetical protein